MIDPNLSVENQVYLIYCEIGNCKNRIQTCTDPGIYFKNYDELLDYFRKLVTFEGLYNFHDPMPHDELRHYKSNANNLEQKFIYRSWESCLNRATTRKTQSGRLKIIQKYYFEMEQFRSRFTPEAVAVLDGLKNELLDIKTIEKRQPPPPPFDFDKERELKRSLQNSQTSMELYYAIMGLMLFYYRYRNLDQRYVNFCIKLCRADIDLLPKVDQEFQRDYGRPFVANIPAFDKLYSIYYKQGDYKTALVVSQAHLYCPQRGNDDSSTLKIQKRIALCQKKQQTRSV